MRTPALLLAIVCLSALTARAQTAEGTSKASFISIGKWKHANADVDKDIPVAKTPNANIIALVIGNEDYKTHQP